MPRQYYTAKDVENELGNKFDDYTKVSIGHPSHLKRLSNKPDSVLREFIASKCDKPTLDKLVNDVHFRVRSEVAKRTYLDHLDKLVNDMSETVRHHVVKYGNKDHLEKLKNDSSPYISQEAQKRLKELNQ